MSSANVILLVRVAAGATLRIKDDGDQDGGWSTIECKNVEEARRIMRDYPTAEMPCWRNPSAVWNR